MSVLLHLLMWKLGTSCAERLVGSTCTFCDVVYFYKPKATLGHTKHETQATHCNTARPHTICLQPAAWEQWGGAMIVCDQCETWYMTVQAVCCS